MFPKSYSWSKIEEKKKQKKKTENLNASKTEKPAKKFYQI